MIWQVLELASRDLSAVIAHDHVCGRELGRCVELLRGSALFLFYVQWCELAHCDAKPRNVVLVETSEVAPAAQPQPEPAPETPTD
eukprot:COSAG01_NODE_34115_length_553_cov_0.669604_1_plen_84_part_10